MSKGIVETLYNIDGSTSKRKIIDMKRVMRGALSISKSATGEEVFRVNQFQNIELRKNLRLLDRASVQCRNGHNSRKRTVLRHWSLVFEKQKSMNESIRELDGVLTEALDDRVFMVSGKTKEEREREEEEQARLRALEEAEKEPEEEVVVEQTRTSMDPAQIRALMIKSKSKGGSGAKAGGGGTLLLPKIDFGDTDLKIEVEVEPEEAVKEDIWPLKDTEWINRYVKDERERHGELFARNIIKNIKHGLTRNHSFYKFRLRSNLSDDPLDVLKTTSAKSRPETRGRDKLPVKSSTAHSAFSPRLTDRPKSKSTSLKTVTIVEPSSARDSVEFPIYSSRAREDKNRLDPSDIRETMPISSSRSQRDKSTFLPNLVRSKTMQ
ncbi:hypothetical protein FSP39_020598 [Pinctada imbricata]|uniref:Uncharacterized protein n=1 Tax=Pinctada imbricata TaxID=66713 RepID=A0AA88XLK2_PINIB|nr:hypothetical protein FSP39_020598 [Pinctada imbricata]